MINYDTTLLPTAAWEQLQTRKSWSNSDEQLTCVTTIFSSVTSNVCRTKASSINKVLILVPKQAATVVYPCIPECTSIFAEVLL